MNVVVLQSYHGVKLNTKANNKSKQRGEKKNNSGYMPLDR